MSTIRLHRTTTSTPEQFVAQGRSEADVTEGSGGIWERLHDD